MGLDSVELLMAIEEEFGVDIPESDAEKMVTVGEVYEWLKDRIASSSPVACLTQRVFYKLRRALVENYGLENKPITPDTRLSELLSLNDIKDGWPFMQLFIDLKTPPFQTADELSGFTLTRKSLTMRELVSALIKINGKAMAPQTDSEEEIWRRLVAVFVRQAYVSPAQITPQARIVRDLGIN